MMASTAGQNLRYRAAGDDSLSSQEFIKTPVSGQYLKSLVATAHNTINSPRLKLKYKQRSAWQEQQHKQSLQRYLQDYTKTCLEQTIDTIQGRLYQLSEQALPPKAFKLLKTKLRKELKFLIKYLELLPDVDLDRILKLQQQPLFSSQVLAF